MKKALIGLIVVLISTAFVATAYAAPGQVQAGSVAQGQQLAVSSAAISQKDALGIALKDAKLKKSQVSLIETECERGRVEVEFMRMKTLTEYDYGISLSDGSILSKEVEYAYKHNSSKAKIGKKAALKKVAKRSGIPYSIVKKARCTYKYRKHEGTYKVKFGYKGYRYEYKLLAPTGKVIEWEKKRTS